MEIKLELGGVKFCFAAERTIEIEPELSSFVKNNFEKEDIRIQVSWDWSEDVYPSSDPAGKDLIQHYYQEDDRCYCVSWEGEKGAIAVTNYKQDFKQMNCFINEFPFQNPPKSLGQVLRFLPMRAVFQHYGVLFFHAAQIAIGDAGILFTGPSGAGKTTQSLLWEKYEAAKRICSDRTLIRYVDNSYQTYGYPIDGSEPVRSTEVNQLKCMVLVKQDKINRTERLSAVRAVSKLMPQMVIDGWNPQARTRATELLLELVQEIPVYELYCRADKEAVTCLKNQLRKDGVI